MELIPGPGLYMGLVCVCGQAWLIHVFILLCLTSSSPSHFPHSHFPHSSVPGDIDIRPCTQCDNLQSTQPGRLNAWAESPSALPKYQSSILENDSPALTSLSHGKIIHVNVWDCEEYFNICVCPQLPPHPNPTLLSVLVTFHLPAVNTKLSLSADCNIQ